MSLPTPLQALKGLLMRSPYCTDRDGNIACHHCGNYREYTSRDGRFAPGQHRPDCAWLLAHVVLDDASGKDEHSLAAAAERNAILSLVADYDEGDNDADASLRAALMKRIQARAVK